MSNWKQRHEAFKKVMGYKNKDVANLHNRKLNSIEVGVTSEKFPEYLKAAIIVCEEMVKNGSIVYKQIK